MAKEDIVTREVSYAGRACELKAFVAEPVAAESSPAAIVSAAARRSTATRLPDLLRLRRERRMDPAGRNRDFSLRRQ